MVKQSFKDDCGKCCLRICLYLIYQDDEYQSAYISSSCDNFFLIKEEFKRYSLSYTSYEVADIDEIDKRNLPAIVRMKRENSFHFVVLTEIDKRCVIIIDPEIGKISLTRDQFKQSFTCEIMLLESVGNNKAITSRFIPKYIDLLFALSFIFMSISSSLFLLFFNEIHRLITFIAIPNFIIGLTLFLSSIFLSKDSFEKNIIIPYMERYKQREDYIHLNRIMVDMIKSKSLLTIYSTLSVIAYIYLLSSSLFFSIIVLNSLLFVFIKILLTPLMNRDLYLSALSEDKYMFSLSNKNIRSTDHYNKSKNYANRYAYINLALTVLEFIFDFIIALLVSIASHSLSFISLISTLSISYCLHLSINNLMNVSKIQDDKNKELNSLSYDLKNFVLYYNIMPKNTEIDI